MWRTQIQSCHHKSHPTTTGKLAEDVAARVDTTKDL